MIWPLVKLADVCEINIGKTPARANPNYWGKGNPWLSIRDMNQGRNLHDTKEEITEIGVNESGIKLVPKGTVLFSFKLSIGKVGVTQRDMYTNEAIAALPIKDKTLLCEDYLIYALSEIDVVRTTDRAVMGATLNKKKLAELKIPLPPLKEQKRIAAILDKADAIRRKRQQAIDLTDQLLRSVFLDMFGDPVTNPKGWDVVSVGEVTDCIVPGRDKPKSFSGDTSWVTTKDLDYLGVTMQPKEFIGLSDEEIKEVKAKVVPENSVLMTCVGDLGVISIAGVPMVINQQLHAFQCGKKLDSHFLMFALSFQKSYMLKMASSTTVPYMNKTICNSVPVIIPPVNLQNKFSEVAIKIRQSLGLKSESKSYILNLFNSLTQQAFNGQLGKQTKAA